MAMSITLSGELSDLQTKERTTINPLPPIGESVVVYSAGWDHIVARGSVTAVNREKKTYDIEVKAEEE
jgi:hypothetical protein